MKKKLMIMIGVMLFWAFGDGFADEVLRGPEVRRIETLIAMLEAASKNGENTAPKIVQVTENEINTYVAYRIALEKEKILKELKFNLLDQDRVKGWFSLDFTNFSVPILLSSTMKVDFNGRIETKDGKGRFLADELFLDGEPITPEFLDMIFAVTAELNGYQSAGIDDWYELPYGIKRVETVKAMSKIVY